MNRYCIIAARVVALFRRRRVTRPVSARRRSDGRCTRDGRRRRPGSVASAVHLPTLQRPGRLPATRLPRAPRLLLLRDQPVPVRRPLSAATLAGDGAHGDAAASARLPRRTPPADAAAGRAAPPARLWQQRQWRWAGRGRTACLPVLQRQRGVWRPTAARSTSATCT